MKQQRVTQKEREALYFAIMGDDSPCCEDTEKAFYTLSDLEEAENTYAECKAMRQYEVESGRDADSIAMWKRFEQQAKEELLKIRRTLKTA